MYSTAKDAIAGIAHHVGPSHRSPIAVIFTVLWVLKWTSRWLSFRIAQPQTAEKPSKAHSPSPHNCRRTSSNLMNMLPTGIPFTLSCDKENIPVTRGERRSRRNALMDVTNSSRRPLLQRGISSSSSSTVCQSPLSPHIGITILTNPARNKTRLPPIHEEKTHSSIAWRSSSSSSSPAPPHTYTILSNPARTRSSPSIQNAHQSSPSVRQSHSSPRITILSNPARERQRVTQPRSTQSTQGKQNVSAAAPAPMRGPTATPISILKAPKSAPAPAADIKLSRPAGAKAPNGKVKVLLPKIVVHQPVLCEAMAKIGVQHPGTGTGTGTTGHGEMLGVPVVSSRSRLRQNDFARYYPKELAAEQIVRRLGVTMRSGNRVAAARRREHLRQCKQTITPIATPTASLSVSRIVNRTRAFMRAHTSTLTPTQTPHHPNCQ
ncbi:hypothetical protein DFH94DRAFT_797275 [Russula ochroleuca]|uniref:Uncharacterized protein n=1 Tax=Russula ochroleuca TaxID=152965 RepID=A0A9P5TEH5_9AGAM|nr:hypothetical protein DFH94DRAFT_797275 [Russula ochroleuca]